jgi:hypothetical protein
MHNAGDSIELGSDGQNDSYRSVVSDLVSLIEHVQTSLRLIEQTMARETSPGGQDANVIVLDDVSPRYVRTAAALRACDANLGAALHFLLDSRTPRRGTSGYAEVPPAPSSLRM